MYKNGIEVLHDSELGIVVEKRSWLDIFETLYPESSQRFYYPNDQDEVLSIVHDGIDVAIIAGQGASMAACMTERLRVYGAKAILRIGTCGALFPHAQPWTAHLTNACFSDEGTSSHYLPKGFPIISSFELNTYLVSALKEAEFPYKVAPTITTDGRWMENPTLLQQLNKIGIETIEMETAGVFAVCQYRHIPVAAINLTTDSPTQEEAIEGDFIGIPDRKKYQVDLTNTLKKIIPIGISALTNFYRHELVRHQ